MGEVGPSTGGAGEDALSIAEVRRVAELARLRPTEAEAALYATQLSAVLGYVRRLRDLNLEGVDPLSNVGETTNRLGEDEPGAMLPTTALMAMAAETMPPFVRVPKVIGEGGA